jgi:hypothetical protein
MSVPPSLQARYNDYAVGRFITRLYRLPDVRAQEAHRAARCVG